ncbi:hypothetical protein Ae201684P_013244 [Aphanomyces euteiches]|nr:hypothetical protein Ae201684P_013244 [Aphanomyces euteiches]
MEDVGRIEAQMMSLMQEGEYSSVAHLGSIFCSLVPSSRNPLPQSYDMHEMYAEALVHKQEYKRALRYFSSCLSLKFPKTAKSGTMTSTEAELRFKMAKCMFHIDDIQAAVKTLDLVHAEVCTLGMNMLLGKLHTIQGLTRKAEAAYVAALEQNPYALEATIALAELAGRNEECSPTNMEDCQIVNLYTQLGNTQKIHPMDASWMQQLVNGHVHLHAHDLQNALNGFEAMDDIVSRSLHTHLYKGKIYLELECLEVAMSCFVQARQCDVSNVELMDIFALLLQQAGLTVQLNRYVSTPRDKKLKINSLVRDLFAITEVRPEPWLAAACYSDLKGDRATALQLCDRAISIDPSFSRSYLMRGRIHLALGRPEHAVAAFSNASKLEKSIEAYEGMVEGLRAICQKGLDKYMDAMNVARLAMMFMPHSPRAFLLLGSVFSLKPESRDQARKAFEKALEMQRQSLRAHFGLVDLLILESNYDEAIYRLERLSQLYARDVVFVKLGDVYTLNRNYGNALPQYHRALAINPNCTKAARGVDRVEMYLRGEDPEVTNMRHLDMEDDSTDTIYSYDQP